MWRGIITQTGGMWHSKHPFSRQSIPMSDASVGRDDLPVVEQSTLRASLPGHRDKLCNQPTVCATIAALTAADAVDGNPDSRNAQVGLLLRPDRQSTVSDLGGRPAQAKDGGVPQYLRVREVDSTVLGHGWGKGKVIGKQRPALTARKPKLSTTIL